MAMGLDPDQNSITLKIRASPRKNRGYTGTMVKPQNIRLSKNLLSVAPRLQSFRLLKALKDPKQLVNRMEQANIEAIAIFFMMDYLRFIYLKLQKISIGCQFAKSQDFTNAISRNLNFRSIGF